MYKIILFFLFLNFTHAQSLQEANDYLDHSDYKNAMMLFSKLQSNAKLNKDVSAQIAAQNGIAACYIDLGANYKALELLKENNQFLLQHKSADYELLAQTHKLLADSYINLYLLEEYFKECHLFYKYYQKAYPNKEIYKALYYAYVGRYYNMRFMIPEAFKHTNGALNIYHKNKKEAHLIEEYLLYNAHVFTIRNTLPSNSKPKFKYVDSLTYFLNKRYPYDNLKKSRVLISIAAPSLDLAAPLYDKNNKGNKEESLLQANKAISIYTDALHMNDKLAGHYYQNSAYLNSLRGLMHFYKGDYKKTLKDYNEGINRLTVSNHLDQNNYCSNNLLLSEILYWKAWCLDDMYEESKDVALLYEAEITLLKMEKVWLRYTKEIINAKKDYNASMYAKQPYNNLARVYYNLYKTTGQKKYQSLYFKYDDKSKYSALLESLVKENQKHTTNQKNKIDITTTLISFEELVLKINDKTPLKKTKEECQTIFKNKFLKDEKTLSKETIFNDKQFSSLTSVQNSLKNDEAIVSYLISGNQFNFHTIVLILTKENFNIIKVIPDDPYNFINEKPMAQQLVKHLENNDVLNYKKTAYECYSNYFQPIEKYLPATIKHIKIIPSIQLANLPFDILLSKESASVDYRKLPYLGNKYQFSYAMSESISELINKKNNWKNNFTIFSPVFNNNILSNLPIANNSAKEITEKYKAKLITGSNATKENFSTQLANNRTLALFSHGKATTDVIKEENGVYLSDGFLGLSEIYDLKSSCDFLILGACETSIGDYEHAEGNINLARAFTAIGVKSMMLSNWKIDEKSSVKIIESFLEYLDQGHSKSEALQKAKTDFLKTASPKTANPLYWAGLNITGSNETISLNNNKDNKIWYGFGVSLFILGGFWMYRKKKKIKTL